MGSDRQASTEDLVFQIGGDAFSPRGAESGLARRHAQASFPNAAGAAATP
jgi:hypothetical protein